MDDSDAASAGARAAPFVPTAMFRAVQDAKATTSGAGSSSSSGGSHQRDGRITEEMDPQELRLKLFALFAENDKLWIQVLCLLSLRGILVTFFSFLALDLS